MNTKRFFVILLIASLAFALLACTKSASEGPQDPGGTNPTLPDVPTQSPDDSLNQAATQTAIAQIPPAVTETPVPVVEPTAIIVPMETPSRPATYTLHKGEFPYCIARRYDINPSELLSLNGLNSSSRTFIGQELKLPQSAGAFPGERSLKTRPSTYTVLSGDTIYGISCLFGDLHPESIIHQNALTEPYQLNAGDVLQIP